MCASPAFQVQVVHGDSTEPMLRLAGELDIAGVAELEAVFEALESLSAEVIHVDLSQLSFLDSAGLQALLAADGRGRDVGRRLVFIQCENRAVRRVFELTGMERYLQINGAPAPPPFDAARRIQVPPETLQFPDQASSMTPGEEAGGAPGGGRGHVRQARINKGL